MSLPIKAIDRLFERLAATYGAQWTRQWADVPVADVKTAWAHELGPYGGRLDAIAWALENLPDHCPNAAQFRSLCRQAPRQPAAALPEPPANPERMRKEMERLGAILAKPAPARLSGYAWVDRVLARVAQDPDRVSPTVRRIAEQADAMRRAKA